MESVLPNSTMAVAVTLKIWIILFSYPYKVLDFMVWHQAHNHTEAFPTLSTQYQVLSLITITLEFSNLSLRYRYAIVRPF